MSVTDHYFSANNPAGQSERQLITFSARGHDIQSWVAGKVFSATRLDPGTEQLLKTIPELPPEGRILDLGCGWGPVALTVATECPQAEVWAVDVNPRAVELTRSGADMNQLHNIRTFEATEALSQSTVQDLYFDAIISNPPVRVGKQAMHAMLLSWLPRLAPDGKAWLVMSKNLGGDSLIKWLGEQGYSASKFASRKGFRIILVQHR